MYTLNYTCIAIVDIYHGMGTNVFVDIVLVWFILSHIEINLQ